MPEDLPHAVSAVALMRTNAARESGRPPAARDTPQTPKSPGSVVSQNGHVVSIERT
jgi:hypothetical protein